MFQKNRNILLSVLFCLPGIFFLINPSKFPADDGFFYPQIAHNITHGIGMNFNDLYLTNGFHPLWMVFCVVADCINGDVKQDVLPYLWTFEVIFIGVGYYLLLKKFFTTSNFAALFSLSFLCLVFFSLGTLFLTEAHLNFFCLIILLFYLTKDQKNDFIVGLLFSFVFLTRLDNFIVLFFLGIYFWKEKKYSAKTALIIAFAFCLLSVPYLFSNQYLFGSLVPISGKIKSSFPALQNYISFGFLPIIFMISGFCYVLFLSFMKCNFRELKIYFTLGSLVLMFYNLLFQSQIGQWYFVSQMIFTAFFIYDFISVFRLKGLEKKWITIPVFLFLLGVLGTISWLKLTTSLSIANNILSNNSALEVKSEDLVKKLAEDLSRKIPKNSRIFIYDFPGKFAFYSSFNVVPADGLVANKTYFKELDHLTFKDFLLKNKIEYVLMPYFLNLKLEKQSGIGYEMSGYQEKIAYKIKNAYSKKIKSHIRQEDFEIISTSENPIKTWQMGYDSVRIYRLKK